MEDVGVAAPQRSPWEGDLASAESLLLHQVDRVGVGAPLVVRLVVLGVLGPYTARSSQIGDQEDQAEEHQEEDHSHQDHNDYGPRRKGIVPSRFSSVGTFLGDVFILMGMALVAWNF